MGGSLKAAYDTNEPEGLTGLTSYENTGNLKELRAEETGAIFERYTFRHEPKTHLPVFQHKEDVSQEQNTPNLFTHCLRYLDTHEGESDRHLSLLNVFVLTC